MSIEGCLFEIERDDAVYDLRNWRSAGITPEEIRIRLEHPELCDHDSYMRQEKPNPERFPNVSGSRIFGTVWRDLQECHRQSDCAQKVIETIMSHKTEELKRRAERVKVETDKFYRGVLEEGVKQFVGALDSFKQNQKTARDLQNAMTHLEHWVECLKQHEKDRERILQELGQVYMASEWISPLVEDAKRQLQSIDRNSLQSLVTKIDEEHAKQATTKTTATKRKKKSPPKSIGDILSDVQDHHPLSQVQESTITQKSSVTNVLRQMEKDLGTITGDDSGSTQVSQVSQAMIVKEFTLGKDGWDGLSCQMPAWSNFNCPLCGKFNASSFLFTFEKDKTEYLVKCEECQGTIKVHVLLDVNNQIVKRLQEQEAEFQAEADLVEKAKKQGYRFMVIIEKPSWEGCKYGLNLRKLHGNSSSSNGEAKTKEQALLSIWAMMRQWEEYDSILERKERVTDGTLFFQSFTSDITKQEILHRDQTRLDKPKSKLSRIEMPTFSLVTLPMLPSPRVLVALPTPRESDRATPEVACDVYVEGGTDPTDISREMYFVQIIPRGITFPEDFIIAKAMESTAELELFLRREMDCYSEEELWQQGDEDWVKDLLTRLPFPFNVEDGQVWLTWKYPNDLSFDKAGRILWNFGHQSFTKQELEAMTVGTLEIVAVTKGLSLSHIGKMKDELVTGILAVSQCGQGTFGNFYNCIYEHRKDCPAQVQRECEAKAKGSVLIHESKLETPKLQKSLFDFS